MADLTTQTTQDQQPTPTVQPQNTVPMFSPDGTLGDVPEDRVPDAVKSGFKMGHDLIAPNGQLGTVPIEKVHDALSSGFTLPAPIKGPVPGAPAVLPGVPGAAPLMQTVPSPNNIASRAWQATKDEAGNVVSGVTAPVKMAIMPPTSAREHAVVAIGGPGALIAYRAAQRVGESAENVFKAKKEDFNQAAVDFVNAAREFHDKDYRSALADTASVAGGVMGLTGDPAAEMGRARELAQGSKDEGDFVTPLTKDVVDLGAVASAEKAPAIVRGVGKVAGKTAEAVNEAAATAAETINTTELRPEMLAKRPEVPAPQHGAPVRVESPLDGPTVGKQLGGKDLSPEALDALQGHVTDKIPVGGTAKGQLMKAVEPVVKVINETASKMNDVIQRAPKFTTSVAQDDVFGEGGLTKAIDSIKKDLPPSVSVALNKDIDAVMEDADEVLNSNDPAEVLEYRRQLGRKIDWDKIENNPSTPAEVQNLARAKVYKAIGDKIHTEIPETVELDKTLQPNLELRSHMQRKLGERVVDDPHAATVEAQSELKKGKDALDVAAHNEQVAKNWGRIKAGLIALGIGSGVIHEIEKFLP